MKHIFYLIIISLFTAPVFGQFTYDYTCPVSLVNEADMDWHKIEPDGGYVTNSTGATKTMAWWVDKTNLPAGWQLAVCDAVQCHAPVVVSNTYTLFGNDTQAFYTQYNSFDAVGTGSVILYHWEVADSANTVNACTWNFEATTPVSIEDLDVNAISIYPNPSIDFLNIEFPTNHEINSIEIINIIGEMVHQEVVSLDADNLYLDTAEMIDGVYYIRTKNENGSPLGVNSFIKK